MLFESFSIFVFMWMYTLVWKSVFSSGYRPLIFKMRSLTDPRAHQYNWLDSEFWWCIDLFPAPGGKIVSMYFHS